MTTGPGVDNTSLRERSASVLLMTGRDAVWQPGWAGGYETPLQRHRDGEDDDRSLPGGAARCGYRYAEQPNDRHGAR